MVRDILIYMYTDGFKCSYEGTLHLSINEIGTQCSNSQIYPLMQ